MIKEAYCSFRTAKLLKEKRFNEECVYFYDYYAESDDCVVCSNGKSINCNEFPTYYSMPTHQMAMAWLREVHNIYINIQPDFPSNKDYKMYWCWSASILHKNCINMRANHCYLDTYEEATEAAIKYCLENLI